MVLGSWLATLNDRPFTAISTGQTVTASSDILSTTILTLPHNRTVGIDLTAHGDIVNSEQSIVIEDNGSVDNHLTINYSSELTADVCRLAAFCQLAMLSATRLINLTCTNWAIHIDHGYVDYYTRYAIFRHFRRGNYDDAVCYYRQLHHSWGHTGQGCCTGMCRVCALRQCCSAAAGPMPIKSIKNPSVAVPTRDRQKCVQALPGWPPSCHTSKNPICQSHLWGGHFFNVRTIVYNRVISVSRSLVEGCHIPIDLTIEQTINWSAKTASARAVLNTRRSSCENYTTLSVKAHNMTKDAKIIINSPATDVLTLLAAIQLKCTTMIDGDQVRCDDVQSIINTNVMVLPVHYLIFMLSLIVIAQVPLFWKVLFVCLLVS